MRVLVILYGVAFAGAPALLQDKKHNPDQPTVPGWHSDLASGMAEAKKTGRPLMVVFR